MTTSQGVALKSIKTRLIYDALMENPEGLTIRELRQLLPEMEIQEHAGRLRKLRELGMVVKIKRRCDEPVLWKVRK